MDTSTIERPGSNQPRATSAASSPKKKGAWSNIAVPVILVVLGLAVLLYPVVATQWNNYRQQEVAQEYSKMVEKEDPATLAEDLQRAHDYNATRSTGPILDPWLARVSKDNTAYQDYLSQLNRFTAMARIIVPTAHADLPVYHGTDDATLEKGVGHLFGSDLPVGGEGTHSVLTGHTGLANATLFDNLVDVKEGDPVYIQVAGEKMKYQVDQIKVVLPEETDDLKPIVGEDLITLVTCTPYGINSHRLLVRAHRVEMDAADDKAFEDSGLHWQWWMCVIVAAAVVILALLAWWIRSMVRKARGAGSGSGSGSGEGAGAAATAAGTDADHDAEGEADEAWGGVAEEDTYDAPPAAPGRHRKPREPRRWGGARGGHSGGHSQEEN